MAASRQLTIGGVMFENGFSQGVYSGLSTPQASLHFPDVVTYAEAQEAMWSLGESSLMFGMNGRGEPVSVNLDADSPHVLISAASGAGKSVTARALATQALCKGYAVIILDAKRHSHRWAKNLPNVHYATGIDEIGNALVSVGMEVHRRNEIVEDWPGDIHEAPVGPRVLVIFEEMNATVDALRQLDKKLPPRGVYTAQSAFADVMFLGRAAKVHVVAVSQFADAKTIPTALRENFGYRVLIRHTKDAWNMLAFGAGYAPPAPQQAGRGFVVTGDKARETQLLFLTEEHCAALVRQRAEALTTSRRSLKRQGREARRATLRARGER